LAYASSLQDTIFRATALQAQQLGRGEFFGPDIGYPHIPARMVRENATH
jgi:hypothetical protein